MNFVILEQWLTELMPVDHKHQLKTFIDHVKEDAPLKFTLGMNHLYPSMISKDEEVRNAALNGLLLGVTLYHAWKVNPTLIEGSLNGFLDSQAKKRGENVYDFLKERAKKK